MHVCACNYVLVSNGQGESASPPLDQADHIARVMAGLSTPSRVRLLIRLRQGPSTVTSLAAAVGMAQPAVSHQLRVLRDLGLVRGRRDVRHIVYSLHDAQVTALLDATLRHAEHLGRP
jgi:DNA-binding transcriptional ArsR family regulator